MCRKPLSSGQAALGCVIIFSTGKNNIHHSLRARRPGVGREAARWHKKPSQARPSIAGPEGPGTVRRGSRKCALNAPGRHERTPGGHTGSKKLPLQKSQTGLEYCDDADVKCKSRCVQRKTQGCKTAPATVSGSCKSKLNVKIFIMLEVLYKF
jgi:hypothetical protein